MSALAGIVVAMKEQQDSDAEGSPSTLKESSGRQVGRLKVPPKRRSSGYGSTPGSPAGRTGPPSSSFPISPALSSGKSKERAHSDEADGGPSPSSQTDGYGESALPSSVKSDSSSQLADPQRKRFARTQTSFRGAWEYGDQDALKPKSGKNQRDSWLDVEAWNPMKWITAGESDKDASGNAEPKEKIEEETLKDERPSQAQPNIPLRSDSPDNGLEEPEAKASDIAKLGRLPRTFSLHQMKTAPTWNRLKALLPTVGGGAHDPVGSTLMQPHEKREVDLIQELSYSGLAPLTLRMWFERDERDERRVPLLMQQLKIRVSDSIYPLSNSKAVFRIECEYANGAARWVIYRQLRDFRKLKRHYRLANFYTLSNVKLPDFQKSAISKIHFYRLKREKGSSAARAEFAKMQREILENYIIALIRAVVRITFLLLVLYLREYRCLRQVQTALLVFSKSPHFPLHCHTEEERSSKPAFSKSNRMDPRKTMGGKVLAGKNGEKADGRRYERAIWLS